MEPFLMPVLMIAAGVFFAVRNIIYLRSDEKLQNYLEKSPKGKLWVSKFGMEKTIILSRKYFLPLGIVMGAGFIAMGTWFLMNALQNRP